MAMSGVTVDDACVQMWTLLKKRNIKGCNFMFTRDFKKIVIDENSIIERNPRDQPRPEWFQQFTESLPEDACRYAIYDFEVGINLGAGMNSLGSRNKLVFIVWAPQNARIKDKMLIASSKDALKKKFDGVQLEWQLNGSDEYEASALIEQLSASPDIKTSGNLATFEGLPVNDW